MDVCLSINLELQNHFKGYKFTCRKMPYNQSAVDGHLDGFQFIAVSGGHSGTCFRVNICESVSGVYTWKCMQGCLSSPTSTNV